MKDLTEFKLEPAATVIERAIRDGLYLALPERVIYNDLVAICANQGLKLQSAVINVFGLRACVLLVPKSSDRIHYANNFKKFLAIAGIARDSLEHVALVDHDKFGPIYFLRVAQTARIEFTAGGVIFDQDNAPSQYAPAARDYAPILQAWAVVSGFEIVYHFQASPNDKVIEPCTAGDTFHVFDGLQPIGNVVEQQIISVDGIPVRFDSKPVVADIHVGRGLQLGFREETVPILALNKNLYIVPAITANFHSQSKRIILAAIQLYWQWWLSGDREIVVESPEEVKAGMVSLSQEMNRSLAKYLLSLEQREEALLEGLAACRRQLAEFRRVDDVVRLLAVADTDRCYGDYDKIRAHELVARVIKHKSGLHVDTKDIVIKHGGKGYRVGRFTIRIPSIQARVVVWPIKTYHPERVPHPHISARGSACFGNAGTVIDEAAAQMRFADCVGYVLSALVDGYCPATAQHKIEEWPLV